MSYLEVNNLTFKTKIRKYENIQITVEDGQVWGVFSLDKDATTQFLDIISGVNDYKDHVLHQGKPVFENESYFKNRIFLDFKNQYLTTIKETLIKQRLEEVYHVDFHEKNFITCLKDLNLRREYEITHQYVFTNLGNTYLNFCLLNGIDKKNIMVNNPTMYVRGHKELEYMTSKLVDKYRYQTMIFGLDNLSSFIGKLDYLLILSDYLGPVIVNPFIDEFYVFEMIVRVEVQNYKLFDSRDKQRIIVYKEFSGEELRFFKKNKIQFVKIKAHEIENYL